MSANVIRYDARQKRFEFDGYVVRTESIGRLISAALMRGEEFVEVRTTASDNHTICTVTVNYLVQMLRITGKVGSFIDQLDHTREHNFNPNVPTP
jgi:type IV pilus biogenesis protein CpaD/CtpE